MIKLILFSFLISVLIACSNNRKKCHHLKDGCFYSIVKTNRSLDTVFLFREGEIQKEKFRNEVSEYKLKCLDSCSYSLFDELKFEKVEFEIDFINKDYYTCYTYVDELSEYFYDTIYFIDCKNIESSYSPDKSE